MTDYSWRSPFVVACAAALLLAAPARVSAQVEFNNNLKYDSGQDVQPVYEGWVRLPNGTFDLYFGYLNRNWVQQMHVPVGPSNTIQPGGPDRGQPTFFQARTNRKVFTVNVPADFGKGELLWTLTVNGKTRTVYGHLKSDWEITPDGGAAGTVTTKEARSNQPPTIAVSPVTSVALSGTATLVATVSDDGLPKPRQRAKPAVGQETPPALAGGQEPPGNLPWLNESDPKRPDGLTVRWFVFRGPADARFAPAHARPVSGQASTSATFTQPGEYVLRAAAEDGLLTTYQDVKITVRTDRHAPAHHGTSSSFATRNDRGVSGVAREAHGTGGGCGRLDERRARWPLTARTPDRDRCRSCGDLAQRGKTGRLGVGQAARQERAGAAQALAHGLGRHAADPRMSVRVRHAAGASAALRLLRRIDLDHLDSRRLIERVEERRRK